MAERTIRYGIIGFGRFAEKSIAPAIRRSKSSELVALQKRSAQAARQKADEHSVPLAFATVEELVHYSDIDAVFITSANSAHCGEAIAAARAGKHVIVEKPMALSSAECEQMIDACSRSGVKLMVGTMVRLSPLIRRMKELIGAGRIGEVKAARAEFIYDARLSSRTWLIDRAVAGGGPVFDIGVHCIDTLRFVLDDEPAVLGAALSPRPTETSTEESASISMLFSRGVVASVLCSYTAPIRRSILEIIGTEAVLHAQDFTRGNQVGKLTISRGKSDKVASVTVEEIAVGDLYVEEISMFTHWILGGPPPEIDGENGLKNQRILDRVITF
ncbi:MAG TPA: Gfo/Idh/MocA family oxidoreductase [Bacteroidota bacterium]|nr:Gfo/Idh/MocA family oxidoreductase [Bacteroidota bacterium]